MTQLTAEQLKPCPYCGGHALRKGDPGKLNEPFGLIADHAPGCFLTLRGFESDEAYDAAWNTRATPDLLSALLAPDEALVGAVARALAQADGLDYDEPCGIQDGEGYCDSGTCVGAYLEDHDADYAREWYDRHARAALIAAGQELARRKDQG